jgi:Fe-Mn family superoxide dismutase
MGHHAPYRVQRFELSGPNGISDQTLEMHFKLYEGYVKETNNLTEKISEFLSDGRLDQEEMPVYSELKRRLGFEYNGMKLHEYYFSNLTRDGGSDPERSSAFIKATTASFGGYERWKLDSVGVGKMRGVGWAICNHDPASGRLSNHWKAFFSNVDWSAVESRLQGRGSLSRVGENRQTQAIQSR